MADNQFASTVDALFQGMDRFITTKTVVGEAVRIDNTIILPLVDVTCGMAAGAFNQTSKNNGAGGMSAKMTPSAILVIQDGVTKLVNIKHQDAMTKIIDKGMNTEEKLNIIQNLDLYIFLIIHILSLFLCFTFLF